MLRATLSSPRSLATRSSSAIYRTLFVREYAVAPSTGSTGTISPEILHARRTPKKEGTIADVFDLTGAPPLPQRFSDLKKEIYHDGIIQSWREVLDELKVTTEEIASEGGRVIPKIPYDDVINGLSEEQKKSIKKTGTVIVKGGVLKDEALAWKQAIRDYAAANGDKVKGTPAENIVFYEVYNSKAQVAARTHPALINTQRALLTLWHSSDPSTPADFSTPISYFDRLRIRAPGPSSFTLGPHIDGGGLERWEDPGYRACFARILEGRWKEHDPFDATPRLDAKQDLYHAPNQCSVFRPWQGWTSMSTTGPREGTLRLLPFLSLSTAYIILRPFFRPKPGRIVDGKVSLTADDWELNLDGTDFPGSQMAKAQLLNEETHPHLRIDKAMISLPQMEPGDQVYWHCDLVHAVEAEHIGKGDSSVLYIPATPLTVKNASYLRDQRDNFIAGYPPPDFPGGEGEAGFKGRATVDDVASGLGRRLLGLEPFEVPSNASAGVAKVIKQANAILF
ncbi:unnamed protein product [Somion occarium]|uniref:DUF1479-domain-containing protein n=1 Tax=Somion occarium TaxID=3059160 RepID=A0ABP1DUW4_9APHY